MEEVRWGRKTFCDGKWEWQALLGWTLSGRGFRSPMAKPGSGQVTVTTFGKVNMCQTYLAMAFGIFCPDNREPVIIGIEAEVDMMKDNRGLVLCRRNHSQ
jgi:hypothetical protein